MPIRFHCKRCRQMLAIATRKAGTDIECPKCGISQVVPSEEAALAASAMDQLVKSQPVVDDAADLTVYDDQPSAIESPRARRSQEASRPAAGDPAGSSVSGPSVIGPSAIGPVEASRPVPQGMILFPRRTFYVQAVLFLILGAAAFGIGYFIGRGDVRDETGGEEKAEQSEGPSGGVEIAGSLQYQTDLGQDLPDENAVVIALPKEKLPDEKGGRLEVAGIGPEAPKLQRLTLKQIRRLGGAYELTSGKGTFFLAVAGQGDYRLLMISGHVKRPVGNRIDETIAAEIAEYFTEPDELIGDYKFLWEPLKVRFNPAPIRRNFGRDRQQ